MKGGSLAGVELTSAKRPTKKEKKYWVGRNEVRQRPAATTSSGRQEQENVEGTQKYRDAFWAPSTR
jgi:hypothetical protein